MSALYCDSEAIDTRRPARFMGLAVERNGHSLAYADEELRADKELVLAAIRTTPSAITHAADFLQMDREVAFAAMTRDRRVRVYLPLEMQRCFPE